MTNRSLDPTKCKKVAYASREEARCLLSRKKGMEIYGKPYKCQICGFWHLGHLPPKKSKVAIRRKKHKRSMKKLFKLIDQICGVDTIKRNDRDSKRYGPGLR